MNANKLLNLTVPCENEFHRALFSEKISFTKKCYTLKYKKKLRK